MNLAEPISPQAGQRLTSRAPALEEPTPRGAEADLDRRRFAGAEEGARAVALRTALEKAEAARQGSDLQAADAALATVLSDYPEDAEIAFSFALNAESAKAFEQALERWRSVRLRFPRLPYPWAAEATMLCILGEHENAEILLSEAIANDVEGIEILATRIQVAIEAGDWVLTFERWTELEARYPDAPYTRLTRVRTRSVVDGGLAKMDRTELRRRACMAEDRRDWTTADLIWDAARASSPDQAHLAVEYGRALRNRGAFDKADQFFCDHFDQFRADVEFRANHAEIAGVRSDWDQAATRWRLTLAEFPDKEVLWSMAATAYNHAGYLDEAEALLERAVSSEPERFDLRVIHAVTAEKRQNWPLAVARWDEAIRLKPGDANLLNSRGNAEWEQQIALLEIAPTRARIPASTSRSHAGSAIDDDKQAADERLLALSFEGLGDHCEFGIVQRRLGADPIGLFRFSAISVEDLTWLLNTRLSELGSPEHTELGLTQAAEYMINDRRGFYHMHTFIQKDAVDPDAFLKQQLRRIAFLKKKLIEDLEAAEKIFVHKSSHKRISDAALDKLSSTLRSYGPNTLLGLRCAEPGHAAGSLEALDDHLFVGYLNAPYSNGQMDVDLASWRRVLRAASRARDRSALSQQIVRQTVTGR